jgi:hypothetical protein
MPNASYTDPVAITLQHHRDRQARVCIVGSLPLSHARGCCPLVCDLSHYWTTSMISLSGNRQGVHAGDMQQQASSLGYELASFSYGDQRSQTYNGVAYLATSVTRQVVCWTLECWLSWTQAEDSEARVMSSVREESYRNSAHQATLREC